jgi:hypothetical protein
MKHTKTFYLLALLALSGFLVRKSLTAQTAPVYQRLISSSRPLAEAANRLRHAYGKPVSYEDPVWAWPGELAPTGINPDPRLLQGPVPLTFVMPTDVGTNPDASAVLAESLDEYHRATSGPRFQMLTSPLGMHIVPVQSRDDSGRMQPAKNPLDITVSIPAAERPPFGHIEAVIAAASSSANVPVSAGIAMFARPGGGFTELFGSAQGKFIWGTSNIIARDAIIDILERSATSFTWELRCSASAQGGQRHCSFSVFPIEVTVTDANGNTVNRGVSYDRCGKCPPLKPQPPPGR